VYDRDARASLFNWTKDEELLMSGPSKSVLQKETEVSKYDLGSIMDMIDKKSSDVIAKALESKGLLSIWND
jgi:hypothetical protein